MHILKYFWTGASKVNAVNAKIITEMPEDSITILKKTKLVGQNPALYDTFCYVSCHTDPGKLVTYNSINLYLIKSVFW